MSRSTWSDDQTRLVALNLLSESTSPEEVVDVQEVVDEARVDPADPTEKVTAGVTKLLDIKNQLIDWSFVCSSHPYAMLNSSLLLTKLGNHVTESKMTEFLVIGDGNLARKSVQKEAGGPKGQEAPIASKNQHALIKTNENKANKKRLKVPARSR